VNREPVYIVAALLALTAGWAAERLFAGRAAPNPLAANGPSTTLSQKERTASSDPTRQGVPAAGTRGEPGDTALGAAALDEAGPPAPTAIPNQLPAFTLEDRNGKPTPIATWRGKSLVLNFWATWCAPCQREIPLLKSLSEDWQTREVAVVGVAVDHRAEVLSFADKFHIGYPLLIGEQDALDAAAALGVGSPVFPFTVFTDRRGEIVALFVGELHRPQAELILKIVQDLNQDRLRLTAAKQAIADGLRALPSPAAG